MISLRGRRLAGATPNAQRLTLSYTRNADTAAPRAGMRRYQPSRD